MLEVIPDYFDSFKCIADKCRHTCCKGWEIDIDEDTLALYEKMEGSLGVKLKNCISYEDTPHFILGENERCPFLNKDNLCEIILEKGEGCLSQICTDHPRFRSFFSDRCETGLGLCCEEAARLILCRTEKTNLQYYENDEYSEELSDTEIFILKARELAFEIAQDRSLSIKERTAELKETFSVKMPSEPLSFWAKFLKSFEILDKSWEKCLDNIISAPLEDIELSEKFSIPMEQFLVYLLYRHVPLSVDEFDVKAQVGFALIVSELLSALCHLKEEKDGCTFEDITEYARLCSSEIEYSEENTEGILNIIRDEN